jgi:EAL domain-containing protein (putative c-di-GMP-specific phosphodiesterase class I)
MKLELPKKWIHNLKTLDVAFQPIINIYTGKIFAVEALLRNYEKVGFNSIFDLFDAVFEDNLLYSFDLKLRKKALKKLISLEGYEDIKLFYNLDNRLLEMPNFKQGNTGKLLKQYGIEKNRICFEISERHEISNNSRMQEVLEHYKSENFCIAIDDFGVGYSGYKLLYTSKPDIIKIDRFFLSDIQKDMKKRLMARSITHLAVQLGIKVIAEGIENKEELLTCRDIGCHFVQGYFIQRPTLLASEIAQEYPHVLNILNSEKRVTETGCKIETFLDKTPPFSIDTEIKNIVKHFQKNPQAETVAIVNSSNESMDILQENKIK